MTSYSSENSNSDSAKLIVSLVENLIWADENKSNLLRVSNGLAVKFAYIDESSPMLIS